MEMLEDILYKTSSLTCRPTLYADYYCNHRVINILLLICDIFSPWLEMKYLPCWVTLNLKPHPVAFCCLGVPRVLHGCLNIED